MGFGRLTHNRHRMGEPARPIPLPITTLILRLPITVVTVMSLNDDGLSRFQIAVADFSDLVFHRRHHRGALGIRKKGLGKL